MSRDKQIEEMAKVIEKMPWRIEQDGLGCRITNNTELAEYFYNAGYRKASEVAEEIFAEIENMSITATNLYDYWSEWLTKLAELKKKYTEEIQ